MSMCRVISGVVGRGCLLCPVHSLGKTLCPASLCIPRPNLPVTPVSLDFLLLHSSPLWWKGHLFRVLVLGFACLHKTVQLALQHYCLGIDLDYYDIEWFALEMNRDHPVVFEIAKKNCLSDSFFDYEGYPISSKGFLPTIVDIMVNWVNSPIPVHFNSLIPKMSIFMLAISCLTTSNLPWLMDLTFQVPVWYCSLQHLYMSP